MPKPENILGQGFHTHPERINKEGRPPKIYTVLKRSGYSKDDIRIAYHELSFLNEGELDKIIADDKAIVLLKVIAQAYKKGAVKGDYRYIKDIIEQVIGQPKQQQEIKQQIEIRSVQVQVITSGVPIANKESDVQNDRPL